MTQGRIVGGRLGEIDEAGVFHAFEPGAGGPFCYGPGVGGAGVRGDASSDRAYLTQGDRLRCIFGGVPPGSRATPCNPRRVRFVRSALYGPGITNVAVRVGHRWKPVQVSPEGGFTVVHERFFQDHAVPDIRIRARACGPGARRDLLSQFTRVSRRGCVITAYLPGGPRPARESKQSVRNRRSAHLRVALRVVRSHALIPGGFRLVFRVPFTIRDVGTEAYAFSVQGPRGPRCHFVRPAYKFETLSDYSFTQGKVERLDIAPTKSRRRFCPGRYRIKMAFQTTAGLQKAHYRLLGSTAFRAPR